MFIVTNREVDETGKRARKGVERFGKRPNPKGPHELRMAEAVRRRDGWHVTVIDDELTPAMKAEVGLDAAEPAWGSQYVSRKLLARLNPPRARELGVRRATGKGRNLVVFIHGFNNDVAAALDRARNFETLYGVEVLAFTWPANGGGLRGVIDYRRDKRDAKASIGALDRVLAKAETFLREFNAGYTDELRRKAQDKHPQDPERQDRYIALMTERGCPFTVNAVFHSMGNYLYKHLLKSGASEGTGLLFDNVVLAAADTNNEAHAEWVDRIRCRRRVYVTINEDDRALAASRLKSGEEQKARLGHWPHGLDSRQAVYVQFTGARGVGDAHAYFEGRPVKTNPAIRKFFDEALNGERAETRLRYDAGTNMYGFD